MIKINGQIVKTFNFSGGEVHPKIEPISGSTIIVKAYLSNADDIMELLLVKNAIDQRDKYRSKHKTLIVPYLPYARQDRVCNPGEALGIKVMADLINSMNFDKVVIYDAHSEVGPALINNCINIGPEYIMRLFGKDFMPLGTVLVSPDAGAEKKVLKVAQAFGGLDVIHASKVRDTRTGNITRTKVDSDWETAASMSGMDLLIVDDICDGGMTFIKLAEELERFNPRTISLYVTHGIFSKGYQPLFDAGIDNIFTTDSFDQFFTIDQNVRVVEL